MPKKKPRLSLVLLLLPFAFSSVAQESTQHQTGKPEEVGDKELAIWFNCVKGNAGKLAALGKELPSELAEGAVELCSVRAHDYAEALSGAHILSREMVAETIRDLQTRLKGIAVATIFLVRYPNAGLAQ